ncbi:MAG: hypothetical protein E7625_06725 [Ruminococcaceae bacterium]|nr:hypothetical protein [Oscillospiraceae bacterium]
MLKNGLLRYARLMGISSLSLLVSMVALTAVRFFTQEPLWENFTSFVAGFIALLIGLGIYAKRDGYANAAPFSVRDLRIYAIAFVCQIPVAALFKFAVYASGPTYFFANFIWISKGNYDVGIGTAPSWFYVLCMLAGDGVCLLVAIIGMRAGCHKRIRDREKILHQNDEPLLQ